MRIDFVTKFIYKCMKISDISTGEEADIFQVLLEYCFSLLNNVTINMRTPGISHR